MKQVNFKFDIEQEVKTLFDTIVKIEMCAVDEHDVLYYAKGKEKDSWYKEEELNEI